MLVKRYISLCSNKKNEYNKTQLNSLMLNQTVLYFVKIVINNHFTSKIKRQSLHFHPTIHLHPKHGIQHIYFRYKKICKNKNRNSSTQNSKASVFLLDVSSNKFTLNTMKRKREEKNEDDKENDAENDENGDPTYLPPQGKKQKKIGPLESIIKNALKSKQVAVFADRAKISNNAVAQIGSAITMAAQLNVEQAYVSPSTIRTHSMLSFLFILSFVLKTTTK